MIIDVVTLFPSMFLGVVGESILNRAQEGGQVKINLVNLRDYSKDKHKKVDAPPYGGGPGMVIMAEPVFDAVEDLRKNGREESFLVLLTPGGVRFDQTLAQELSKQKGLILLCGHYEGFDERVSQGLSPLEVSIGDYVLTGGEIPAMVLLDSVTRLLPGVLGSKESLLEESFSSGSLEYPQFTRPQEVRGLKVPEVLVSGDHAKVAEWREEKSKERTEERRPDLAAKKKKSNKQFRQL
ncbi:MAG TPA: tRNA (guanosine(37)-N1)-methyltransferase TrmD [Planctomycetota bacterium]|nr:tRNA (guanosine(37)-N1)-methyltransferase TrmD [Planctomycetota bacterium]